MKTQITEALRGEGIQMSMFEIRHISVSLIIAADETQRTPIQCDQETERRITMNTEL